MPRARPAVTGRGARLVGLDVARCLALVGMIATHTLPERAPDGGLTAAQWLAGGRASALFAVLAGVTLALLTARRGRRVTDRARLAASVAVRAVLLGLLGLALGGVGSGLAVILAYYAVLFVLGLPSVGLGARALLLTAAVAALVVPVLSHLVRPHLPPRSFDVPSFASLGDPGGLAADLLLTGYYPALPWLTYLLAGLALGRLDLRSRAVARRLLVGGTVAAVGAVLAAAALTALPGVRRVLEAEPLYADSDAGLAGTTPTGGPWEWLLVAAPHSATPLDLAATAGSALAVIGGCLLVVGALGARSERVVAVLFGAGTMTLTLYSLHVLLRTEGVWPPDEGPAAFRAHALLLLWVGAFFVAVRSSGPLEWLLSRLASAVRGRSPDPSR